MNNLNLDLNVTVIEPVGYLEMLWLLKNCSLVVTDSGGVQKEAFFFNKPCVTMRDQTEWVELIEEGVNMLAGADTQTIIDSTIKMLGKEILDSKNLYGGVNASIKIVEHLTV